MSDPITRLYQNFREQAEPWAIASTSTEALASDIADMIGDEHATGYPTDGAGSVDLYALARQVQTMAAAEASAPTYDEGNPSDDEQPWCNECGSLVVAGHCNCDLRTRTDDEDDERTLVRDAELLGEDYGRQEVTR